MSAPSPLAKGSTIGILGSGQLGQMLAEAASSLGFKTHIYSPERNTPAGRVATAETQADYLDFEALTLFGQSVDVVTYEFENVPAETASHLEAITTIYPDPKVLAIAQDRLTEKQFLTEIGERTAPFANIESQSDLNVALTQIGLPAVLKTRRLGYDGKGQIILRTKKEAETAFDAIGAVPSILEGFVAFQRELSVIAARASSGETACFDPGENEHTNHILSKTIAPARIPRTLRERAKETAENILIQLQYVGVMGVELFETDAGGLVVNEIAPRVHNTGHWTQDGCTVSQFEQHIRAICRLPLGDPARHSDAIMMNLIGNDVHDWEARPEESGTFVHLYGKHHARPGRKMGHVNRLLPYREIVKNPEKY